MNTFSKFHSRALMFIKTRLLMIIALTVTSCAPVYTDLAAQQASIALPAASAKTQQHTLNMHSHKIVDSLELATQKMEAQERKKERRPIVSNLLRLGKILLNIGYYVKLTATVLLTGACFVMGQYYLAAYGCIMIGLTPIIGRTLDRWYPNQADLEEEGFNQTLLRTGGCWACTVLHTTVLNSLATLMILTVK
jgi:hypothetical protein